jgi:hypothetical protein
MATTDCAKCLKYMFKDGVNGYWILRMSCASVGIEYNKSTDQMLNEYMAGYHKRGHRE